MSEEKLVHEAMDSLLDKIYHTKKERDECEKELSNIVQELAPLLRKQQEYTSQIDNYKRLLEKFEQQQKTIKEYLSIHTLPAGEDDT